MNSMVYFSGLFVSFDFICTFSFLSYLVCVLNFPFFFNFHFVEKENKALGKSSGMEKLDQNILHEKFFNKKIKKMHIHKELLLSFLLRGLLFSTHTYQTFA